MRLKERKSSTVTIQDLGIVQNIVEKILQRIIPRKESRIALKIRVSVQEPLIRVERFCSVVT